MKRRLSIRWKLILSTFTLVLGITCGLGIVFHVRTHAHLLAQLEKTLETKCDEVLSVLEGEGSALTLQELFAIETNYRYSPYTYFYQVWDGSGRVRARSSNLGEATLPAPGPLLVNAPPGGVLLDDAPSRRREAGRAGPHP